MVSEGEKRPEEEKAEVATAEERQESRAGWAE
jgi:hypothetical protein